MGAMNSDAWMNIHMGSLTRENLISGYFWCVIILFSAIHIGTERYNFKIQSKICNRASHLLLMYSGGLTPKGKIDLLGLFRLQGQDAFKSLHPL